MYTETLGTLATVAANKARLARTRLPAYLLHAGLAGAYVGLGIILIFAFGTPLAAARSPFTGLIRVWYWSWLGNLVGSALVAVLVWQAHLFADPSWVLTVAAKKMNSAWSVLFVRAILCNWLVVLAVWSYYKLKSEAAKLMMVWWCLLAFIGSGYEHSVANMTLLTLANLLPHGPEISWAG